jgi:hypothetical protein
MQNALAILRDRDATFFRNNDAAESADDKRYFPPLFLAIVATPHKTSFRASNTWLRPMILNRLPLPFLPYVDQVYHFVKPIQQIYFSLSIIQRSQYSFTAVALK